MQRMEDFEVAKNLFASYCIWSATPCRCTKLSASSTSSDHPRFRGSTLSEEIISKALNGYIVEIPASDFVGFPQCTIAPPQPVFDTRSTQGVL